MPGPARKTSSNAGQYASRGRASGVKHLSLRQRIVFRLAGIKASDDLGRWTAPRKHREVVIKAFERGCAEMWREGKTAYVEQTDDTVTLVLPGKQLVVRLVD